MKIAAPHRRLAAAAACLGLAGWAADSPAFASTATTPSGSHDHSTSRALNCGTGTLNGEGSTAQANAIGQWISDYQSQCKGTTINYNGTGSGAGIKQFLGSQVDWAGSDSSLKPAEATAARQHCAGNDAWNIPMAVGPIAVSYNVSGVDNGLVLDGPTIAKIFTGKITKWNDSAIAGLNPGKSLPGKGIKVFFRSDESGTTENFEKYLAAAGGGNFTAAPAKAFGGGVGEGQAKSAGVQQAIKATDGAIGYIEYSFARDAKLGVAKVRTGDSPVELTPANAGRALAAAKPTGSGNDLALKLDYATTAPDAYPIVLVTYEIVCSKGLGSAKTDLLKSFLTYTSSNEGQQTVTDIGYGVLPPDLATKVAAAIEAIAP